MQILIKNGDLTQEQKFFKRHIDFLNRKRQAAFAKGSLMRVDSSMESVLVAILNFDNHPADSKKQKYVV